MVYSVQVLIEGEKVAGIWVLKKFRESGSQVGEKRDEWDFPFQGDYNELHRAKISGKSKLKYTYIYIYMRKIN